ncbi:hypothetical protein ABZZ36_18225 [Actinacidiphila glaucinigra]|uniref:hypothetical protein n=1 Tax=Actinacidiphila glaucinigra TaxID=235986 RepID=UPI0033B28889
MMETRRFPEGWIVFAVPSGFSFDAEPTFRTVQVDGRMTVPADFVMLIASAEMRAKDPQMMIIVDYIASESGIRLHKVFGTGDWIDHLAEVVQEFPPSEWQAHAERVIVNFMLLTTPERLEAAKPAESVVPLPVVAPITAGRQLEPGVQRRRKITHDHLREVATVYSEALENDDPPTRAVQQHFRVSHSTAAKWVGQARKGGMLPPAKE